ncbi:vWA domain-containing protein [Amycolatopsis thermoflava]|uniref:vWA domain-containing protein n=1 Tax=Amycolatopsis thermoflava TaxID=84480 RepID=UPI003F4A4A93
MSDLAELAARLCERLRSAGLAVGADRAARFARAVMLVSPQRTRELYLCALTTLTSSPADAQVLASVFATVFAAPEVGTAGAGAFSAGESTGPAREVRAPTAGSAVDRLATRDFATLEPPELALLRAAMSEFRLATPLRRSRRKRLSPGGRRADLRETLRVARRTGGEPVRLRRWVSREKPRKLVVLCDISGSMEPYARALLQLLVCAAGGARAEVFTFATRLTRLTRVLQRTPSAALADAGREAPDWSGGTKIGDSLGEFLDTHGARGMARGAVVVVLSDGWETGSPERLGREMARLSRLAYRIVWANPRTASPRFRPSTGGMAAAWPYCDAVVSAHRLDAIEDLLTAIAGCSGRD